MSNHNVDVMTSSDFPDYSTPQKLVDDLPFIFELDVCATHNNTKCKSWISPVKDALKQTWGKRICWMNPPYGRNIGTWVQKAKEEADKGSLVVSLIPNRTETQWFDTIWNHASLICFMSRRIKFEHPEKPTESAPFANVIAVFGNIDLMECVAELMQKFGTVIVPGYENIYLADRPKKKQAKKPEPKPEVKLSSSPSTTLPSLMCTSCKSYRAISIDDMWCSHTKRSNDFVKINKCKYYESGYGKGSK